MNKEDNFIKNRFFDLANISYNRNIYTYSDFLNLNEISILNSYKNQLPPVNLELAGGNSYAERKIAIFSPTDIYYSQNIPIKLLEIAPINPNFADALSHRDILGAILNLGIVRGKIGDIFLKENKAYVYCIEDISQYIADNIRKIKHTLVKCTINDMEEIDVAPDLKNIRGTVSNIRLDSLIALAFGTSRSSIVTFIESGKVFVNGKLVTSNGYNPKEKDIISVRGKGRFVYEGHMGVTKKGRNTVSINLYI